MREFFIVLISLFLIPSVQAQNLDSLFHALDISIQERVVTLAQKENHILRLKERLSQSASEADRYQVLQQLVEAYRFYKVDSALYYSNQCLTVAKRLERTDYVVESELKIAYFLSFLHLFHESFQRLEAIDFEQLPIPLQKQYLWTIIFVYHNQSQSLVNSYFKEVYSAEILKYCALYFEIEKEETFEYLALLAYRCYLKKDFKSAERIVKQILEEKELSDYQRVQTLFHLAGVYIQLGEDYMEDTKRALIESAILCNKVVFTKNPPLLQLALLIAKEDYRRASNYIDIAVKDASVFSLDYRIAVREKTYNAIQGVYYAEIAKQKQILQYVLIIVFFLCFIILSISFVLYRKNRVLRRMRRKLVRMNHKLKDANRIKEIYISYFLNQYSNYIDKITENQKHVLRLINAGHSTDVIKKEALSVINTKQDLNEFFADFDKSILELFPTFVEEVNRLLRANKVYVIQNGEEGLVERLNTELRILALLRLGITDNKEIASFFRFTVQTVYNYRSKAKSRAIDEDSFEENIKNVCKYEW